MKLDISSLQHPTLLALIKKLSLENEDNLSVEKLEFLLKKFNQILVEQDEARDLLERSLKIASDEIQESLMKQINMSKMQLLGEISSNIAHEINNPVAVIQARTQILQTLTKEDPSVLTAQFLSEKLSIIEKCSRRVTEIIASLKSFTRDGTSDAFQIISLSEILNEVCLFSLERMAKSDINFILSPNSEPNNYSDLYLSSRPAQISQVILNLLNNAVDAIDEAKNTDQQSNKPRWIKLDICYDHQMLYLRIVDNGSGISDGVSQKIMQPFFTTKGVGKGTGLGLSISSHILADHGGSLKHERQNPNTCFCISLPLAHKSI